MSFSRFGDEDQYHKNNMPNGICIYKKDDPSTHLCPIFRLGDIVELAGGNFSKIAIKGGVLSVQITWCMEKCGVKLKSASDAII